MSIPHNCIGSPCLICNPRQTIFGTTPEKVIDCNPWRVKHDPRDAELASLRSDLAHLRREAGADSCAGIAEENAKLRAEVERLRGTVVSQRDWLESIVGASDPPNCGVEDGLCPWQEEHEQLAKLNAALAAKEQR